jgi:hypothetical protein
MLPTDPDFEFKLELLETKRTKHTFLLSKNLQKDESYAIFSFLRILVEPSTSISSRMILQAIKKQSIEYQEYLWY